MTRMKLRVTVMRGVIEDGVQEDKGRCPLAQAIKLCAPGIDFVEVDNDLRFTFGGADWRSAHTDETLNFVHAFDEFGAAAVDPFDVDLTFEKREAR